MKIYYWSPFISSVATTTAVINSIKSIKKFGNKKINCKIINVFKEWNQFEKKLSLNKIDILNLKTFLNINFLPKEGFLKSRFTYLLTFIFSILNLHFLLKKDLPNFIIIHLISSIPLTLLAIFNYETNFILRVSGYPKLTFFRKFLWKIINKKIYRVFCPTNMTKDLLIKNKIFSSEKIFVVHDPILDIEEITYKNNKELIKDYDLINNKEFIISIGRLTKQKNFNFLIDGFEKILNKNPKLYLFILGEGEEKKLLNNVIKEKKLDQKIFLIGAKENIYPYLSKALFFVLTSNWEDPGFVIVESMFAKKIVLSSNCPSGPLEIIKHNKNGFLYENNNIIDFIDKFNLTLRVQKDEKKNFFILREALKSTKYYTLFNHYKEIIQHLI